jgi:hypothetical protein
LVFLSRGERLELKPLKKLVGFTIAEYKLLIVTRVDEHWVFGVLEKLSQLGLRLFKHVLLDNDRTQVFLPQVVSNMHQKEDKG